jgi:hypothetical protein
MKKQFIRLSLLAILAVSNFSNASTPTQTSDPSGFEGEKVTAQSTILMIANTRDEDSKKGPSDEIFKLFVGADVKNFKQCKFPKASELKVFDCGIKPVSVYEYDDLYRFSFPVLESKKVNSAQQVRVSEKTALWAQLGKQGNFEFKVESITKWLTSGDSIQITSAFKGKNLKLHSAASDGSKVVTDCQATQYLNDGLLGAVEPEKITGDWMHITCKTSNCTTGSYEEQQDEANKGKAKCLSGWVRWRSIDSQLLLLPANNMGD